MDIKHASIYNTLDKALTAAIVNKDNELVERVGSLLLKCSEKGKITSFEKEELLTKAIILHDANMQFDVDDYSEAI